jgi:ribonucleotide reductase alpha subunit
MIFLYECIEPITSNIYSRRTIAGEFILANKYLMNDLILQSFSYYNLKMSKVIVSNYVYVLCLFGCRLIFFFFSCSEISSSFHH